MNRKLVGIREAAEFLGVTLSTLRRWEREGTLLADERTPGGYRRDDLARLRPEQLHRRNHLRKTVAYARVSSHDQQDDLERQKQVLELYCARQGGTFEAVADLGSGMNYHKKGLKRLLHDILADRVGRLEGIWPLKKRQSIEYKEYKIKNGVVISLGKRTGGRRRRMCETASLVRTMA